MKSLRLEVKDLLKAMLTKIPQNVWGNALDHSQHLLAYLSSAQLLLLFSNMLVVLLYLHVHYNLKA